MERLSLEEFKLQADASQTEEIENLTGGIMGACHTRPWYAWVFDAITGGYDHHSWPAHPGG